jgi:quercetin dioxygenase-like cupin family protein
MLLDATATLRALLEELAATRGKRAPRASLAVVQRTMDRGEMSPSHVHPEPEAFHVVEGGLTLFVGGETVRLRAGEAFVAPAGIAHAHRADAGATSYLAMSFVQSVDLYESFLAAVAHPEPGGEPEPDESDRVAAMLAGATSGITVLGPPGDLPAAAWLAA